ncbi:MAG: AsnC family protein [Gammaproteobacteria bacterium]|nr:AsnC family protein [Gammaproteobacteria bacterium]
MADLTTELIAAVQNGLPLTPAPYADVAARLGVAEETVLAELRRLADAGVIKRLGVVVRHHELGFRANAMVVWDVPDDRVAAAGRALAADSAVTLCYRRPRRLPLWPYNLFCMIHGRDRTLVHHHIDRLRQMSEVADIPYDVLFSLRRFKQRGARYAATGDTHGEQRGSEAHG